MNILYLEIGVFTIALVLIILVQIQGDRKKYRDCLLFSRLLIASFAVLVVDTVGWLIDGNPVVGQLWFTAVIDGLDLILTSTVCWTWVQYACFIVDEEKQRNRKWYTDFSSLLLLFQIILVTSSQYFGFYYYIDASGVYHRGDGYIMHTLISMAMLTYSSGKCIIQYFREEQEARKKELLFVASVILIPVAGNIFQFFVYGFPTVWMCMVFMIIAVYIHIQNKRHNEERQEQNRILSEALAQAQTANAAKTEFFARMSHDMRTPMNGILGLANLSVEEQDEKVLKNNICKMKSAGEYMLGLINDTLDFQKIESGKMILEPQIIQAGELVDSICSMVSETAREKGINFKINNRNVELGHYIQADPLRLKQILINLLSNAVKFTPTGGTVELGMENLGKDDMISHEKITVTDTGIGMSKEFLESGIFKPFSQEYNQVTAKTSGTGLGLSIAKQLTELMGGKISVESDLGSGTRFEIIMDFECVENARVKKDTEEHTEQREFVDRTLKGLKILMAEDHPLNAEIAIRLLKKKGCEVSWAKNGKECVEQFRNLPENWFDVILMDIRMPVQDGLEASREIRGMNRRDAKRIPIIAMTANAYDGDVKQVIDAGMDEHIPKPIEPEFMYNTIAKQQKKNKE